MLAVPRPSARALWVAICGLVLLLPVAAQNLPDGPGKETFAGVCSECHALEAATSQKLSKVDWQVKVDAMAAKGARASKEQFAAIVEYLAKNFGPQESAAAEPPKVMPEGEGKQIILRECTTCHQPDHFTKYQHTPEEWQAIVMRMSPRVRSISKEEVDTVQKYLSTNFPKVESAGKLNVNKATAKDIETQLALTPEEAQAVVQYRQQHGTFRDWGELLAIYGVDGRKIEAAKQRMSF